MRHVLVVVVFLLSSLPAAALEQSMIERIRVGVEAAAAVLLGIFE